MKIERVFFKSISIFCLLGWVFFGCSRSSGCEFTIGPGPNAQTDLQNAMNQIQKGCIELGKGTYEFSRTLTMDEKSGVTIRGVGRETTILSFKEQISGGDGVLITNGQDIVVRDLTIRDSIGDALKFRNTDGVFIYRVGTVWNGEPSTENGAYGLYPVLSKNILIDECYAYGASDAGIYVGQSDKVIVRNSIAEGNVAGIEMENTTNADVYDNVVTDNAAGILVFDLPNLSQLGSHTRVFNNRVINNLRGNFAPGGNIVAQVPAGTGILVLSTSDVEIFGNTIEGNNVMGSMVASYAALVELGLVQPPTDPDYNLFPQNVYIHDNTYERSNSYPNADEQSEFGNMLVSSFGANPIPDILIDGIFAPGSGQSGSICLENNQGNSFVNLNLPNNFPANLSFDSSPHSCRLVPLPAVELGSPNHNFAKR